MQICNSSISNVNDQAVSFEISGKFRLRSGARPVLLKFHSQNGFEVQRRYSHRWPSRWAAKFSHQYFFRAWRTFRKIFCDRHFAIGYHFNCTVLLFRKLSCLLYRNFISIHKINRTLHGRMGIRILSSLTGEKCFQHGKIKFVSPRSHVISSMYHAKLFVNVCETLKKRFIG